MSQLHSLTECATKHMTDTQRSLDLKVAHASVNQLHSLQDHTPHLGEKSAKISSLNVLSTKQLQSALQHAYKSTGPRKRRNTPVASLPSNKNLEGVSLT